MESTLQIEVRSIKEGTENYYTYDTLKIRSSEAAVIISDMWNKHWCDEATKRVAELAVPLNELVCKLRDAGVVIIHCPSMVREHYRGTKAYERMNDYVGKGITENLKEKNKEKYKSVPDIIKFIDPRVIECDCNTVKKCEHGDPWQRQIDTIIIDHDKDFIADASHMEELSAFQCLLDLKKKYVFYMGVHTNMCMFNKRPFGIQQLCYRSDITPILIRDMTDCRAPREELPFKDHFTALDDTVHYLEKYWCQSTSRDGISIDGKRVYNFPYSFSDDIRNCNVDTFECAIDKTGVLRSRYKKYSGESDYLKQNFLPTSIVWIASSNGMKVEVAFATQTNFSFKYSLKFGEYIEEIYSLKFGEYIKEITGICGYNKRFKEYLIRDLKFKTNKANTFQLGGVEHTFWEELREFRLEVPPDYALVYIEGYVCEQINLQSMLSSISIHSQQLQLFKVTPDGQEPYVTHLLQIKDSSKEKVAVMFFNGCYFYHKGEINDSSYEERSCIDFSPKGKEEKLEAKVSGMRFMFKGADGTFSNEDSHLDCEDWAGNRIKVERYFEKNKKKE